MHASNLPSNVVVLFFFILLGSSLITGCTSRKIAASTPSENRLTAGFVININTASDSDLQRLPHVGPALAKKIIQHRQRYGPFRKPEHVLIVEGVSEERFRDIRKFITTE